MYQIDSLTVKLTNEKVMKLMSYPACNYLVEYYSATRQYHDGIKLSRFCRELLQSSGDVSEPCQYSLDYTYIFELHMLYELSYWKEYMEVYEGFHPLHRSTVKDNEQYEMVKKMQSDLESGKIMNIRHSRKKPDQFRCDFLKNKILKIIGGN